MFSKLMIASTAYLTANGIGLRSQTRNRSKAGQPPPPPFITSGCGSNIDRWSSPHETVDYTFFSDGSMGPYYDNDFPATVKSLYWTDHLRPNGAKMVADYDKVSGWARPSELVDSPSLWGSNGVQPTGTNQGQLGDCWFLAAAAAIAENPERIKKIFTNKNYNSAGIFQVTFYNEGKPIKITVDDRIPVTEGTRPGYTDFGVKTPVNSNMSTNGAWWVVILEKAYAKFNVNYSQINYGQNMIAMRDMTGMPVWDYQKIKAMSDSELFSIINEADENNWVMTSTCMQSVASLTAYHAYSILGAYELIGGPKVLKMRNPWGSELYAGRYRDDDPAWTAAQKEQVGLTVADDGIFFIPVDDFLKAFDDFQVLMYQDWNVDRLPVSGTEKQFMHSFTSPVDQEVIITIEYTNERYVEEGCPKTGIFLNMYIDSGEARVVEPYSSYGITKFQAKAGQTHELKIYNWADAIEEAEFVIQTFAANGKVVLG